MQAKSMRPTISVDGQEIESTVTPTSLSELQDVVREIEDQDRHALITGSGSRLRFGNSGGPFDLAVSTQGLDHILEYSPADLTIAVEAGCAIENVNSILAEHNQMLALDTADPATNTIGGMFAAGLDGPRRFGFGSLKDAVIGVETVLADGTLVKSGGMVVKNVTGYDMARVYHGSLGAFGIVTRLNLKVVPMPPRFQEYSFTFGSFDEAHSAATQCLTAGLEFCSLYSVGSEPGTTTLQITVAGIEPAVQRIGARLSELIYETATPVDANVQSSMSGRLPAFERFISYAQLSSLARISVPASQQLDTVERLRTSGWLEGSEILADYGSGLLYLSTDEQPAVNDLDGAGLQLSWLALDGELKSGIEVFGPIASRNLAIIRRLKHEFDPVGRFNRGRFVGGL